MGERKQEMNNASEGESILLERFMTKYSERAAKHFFFFFCFSSMSYWVKNTDKEQVIFNENPQKGRKI